jgi:small GTP-binding protein
VTLNANHRRALLSGFASIDATLQDIEAKLSSPSASPFATLGVDLEESERSVVLDYVARARGRMIDALPTLGIAMSRPRGSVRSRVQTGLTFALIAIDELEPSRLRGYGDLDGYSSGAIDRTLADLRRTLRKLQQFVSRDPALDIAARLDRIDLAPIDVNEIRRIEQIASRRGFLELRGPIAALTEQLETRTFEIAVFGRVSSGKSSLLDAILERSIVPVGVTPVTAVPTRLVYGDIAGATVDFESGANEEIAIEQLPAFVTEQQNPDNARRVLRVTARVPASRLVAGVALVDTPGVGSLARAGARSTYSYLPRCDLGVLLVDASGAIAAEDVEIIRLLGASGVRAELVLSKADLVAEADRSAVAAYVSREVHAATGLTVVPAWVSNTASDGSMARAWFDERIAPLLVDTRGRAEESMKAKLAQLRADLIAALRSLTAHQPSPQGRELANRLASLASEAQRQLDAAESRAEDIAFSLRDSLVDVVRAAARAKVAGSDANASSTSDAVARAMRAAVTEVCEKAAQEVTAVSERLTSLCREMTTLSNEQRVAPPPFAIDFLSLPSLRIPEEVMRVVVAAKWLPTATRRRRVTYRLADEAGDAVARALHDLSRELREWVKRVITALGEQFAAATEPIRENARRAVEPLVPQDVEGDLLSLKAAAP